MQVDGTINQNDIVFLIFFINWGIGPKMECCRNVLTDIRTSKTYVGKTKHFFFDFLQKGRWAVTKSVVG